MPADEKDHLRRKLLDLVAEEDSQVKCDGPMALWAHALGRHRLAWPACNPVTLASQLCH
jgi:hypothetical protein